jgi:hypothetical protein
LQRAVLRARSFIAGKRRAGARPDSPAARYARAMATRAKGPYVFGEETFRTKKEATAFIRGILYRYPLKQPLAPADFTFMLAVLERHPRAAEKIGVGVKAIHIEKEEDWTTRQFVVTRVDGTHTEFSFVKCIHPASKLQDFKKACRDLVANDIKQFRHARFAGAPGGQLQCPITGLPMTRLDSHVDHEPPLTFDSLVEQFIREESLDIDAVEITGSGDRQMRKGFTDADLAVRWKQFHRSHARLRVVSGAANLSDIKLADE